MRRMRAWGYLERRTLPQLVAEVVVGGELGAPGHLAEGIDAPFSFSDNSGVWRAAIAKGSCSPGENAAFLLSAVTVFQRPPLLF